MQRLFRNPTHTIHLGSEDPELLDPIQALLDVQNQQRWVEPRAWLAMARAGRIAVVRGHLFSWNEITGAPSAVRAQIGSQYGVAVPLVEFAPSMPMWVGWNADTLQETRAVEYDYYSTGGNEIRVRAIDAQQRPMVMMLGPTNPDALELTVSLGGWRIDSGRGVVSMSDIRAHGAEAIIRWKTPEERNEYEQRNIRLALTLRMIVDESPELQEYGQTYLFPLALKVLSMSHAVALYQRECEREARRWR